MNDGVFTMEEEVKLLEKRGQLLRDRIEGMTEELRGKSFQLRSLAQEVDLYSDAIDKLVKDNRRLRLENHAKDSLIADLRSQLEAARRPSTA